MSDRVPKAHHTVNEVMRKWPQTVWVFVQHGMACPGCAVGDFHTVEEAALEYQIPLKAFLAELCNAVHRQDWNRPSRRKSTSTHASPR